MHRIPARRHCCLGAYRVWALLRPTPTPEKPPLGANSLRATGPLSPVPVLADGPKLLAYRLALNRSPEALEQMLTAEEARPSRGAGPPLLRNLARSEAGWQAGSVAGSDG
jgi:hypothetical protein